MFTFTDQNPDSRYAKDMAKVAKQLNEMPADKAAWWMAERQRWIANYAEEHGDEALLEKLGYDAFELAACQMQLMAWETQATQKVAA